MHRGLRRPLTANRPRNDFSVSPPYQADAYIQALAGTMTNR